MATISFQIQGMEELRASLNLNRIQKEVAVGIGQAAKKLHSELRFAVLRRYNSPYNLDRLWINGNRITSSMESARQVGRSILQFDMLYQNRRVDLSKFPYSFYEGSINPPEDRTGMVHEVSVIRGRSKIVYGKQHRGGFVPRKAGRAVSFGRHGAQMFERKSKKRFPLRLLVGPSVGNMLDFAFREDIATQKAATTFVNYVAGII